MSDFVCKKCGSNEYEIKDKPNGTGIAHGLYCAKCGFWHKWLGKEELKLYAKKESKDEVIALLQAENAELKARLEKAVELPRIIHPNPTEWHIQYQYESGIIAYDIRYSETKAEARLAELKNIYNQ